MTSVKTGPQTSEFAGKTVTQLLVMGLAYFDVALSMETALTIVAGLEAIYTVVRGHVKAAASKATS